MKNFIPVSKKSRLARALFLAFLPAIFLGVLFFPLDSMAKKKKTTDPMTERVAFAFYKLGGVMPDFKAWVESRPEFEDVRISDRDVYTRNEILSLKQRFASYNLDNELISVKIIADLGVEEIQTYGSFDPNAPRRFHLSANPNSKEILYFPYDVNGQYIAVIANKIETLLTKEVDEALFESIRRDIEFDENRKSGRIVLNFLLRPVSADMNQPMLLDGKNQWLMMAEIAMFSAETLSNGTMIWEYRAPWFFFKTEKTVGSLYRE